MSRLTSFLIKSLASLGFTLALLILTSCGTNNVFSKTSTVPAKLVQNEPEYEFIKLPFKLSRTFVLEKFETDLINLINRDRKKEGLSILTPDPELRTTSRDHSYDMLIKGYFSHRSMEGKSPFDRLNKAGVIYTMAAENIAFAQTIEMVHNGLMKSPGHRANILNPKFGRIGIGIMDAGKHGMMVTQNFRN